MLNEVLAVVATIPAELEKYQCNTPLIVQKELQKELEYVDEISQHVADITKNEDQTNSFYLVDLEQVRKRIDLWDQLLPRVNLFFAMKCNPDNQIIRQLIRRNKNFDCACFAEIQQVVNLGGNIDKIIYAHPMKDIIHYRKATQMGVNFTVYDSVEELEKVHKVNPNAQLLLRIAVLETEARCPMTKKFGALPQFWNELLEKAKKLNISVRGVSFHVGSGGCKAEIFEQAILNAKKVFDLADALEMPAMDIIDIGGGFTMDGKSGQNFNEVAPAIQNLLDRVFPPESNVTFMGEPGRFIAQSSATVAMRIIGVKDFKESGRQYYINGGIYQGFASQIYDFEYQNPEPLLPKSELAKRKTHSSVIWGQTCDGYDVVTKNVELPQMEEGEWIIFRNMGAYAMYCDTKFNGFNIPDVYYINENDTK